MNNHVLRDGVKYCRHEIISEVIKSNDKTLHIAMYIKDDWMA